MKQAYPVFIKESQGDYLVYIPDFESYTEGKSFVDAIEMARDNIGLNGINLEDDNKKLPYVSTKEEALQKAKEDADEDFDFSDGVLSFVDVDFTAYRNKLYNKAVRKNCTIPYWLNEKAEQLGINFSKVLQDALINMIEVK